MELKISRLFDWLEGRPMPPTILHVHLTNRCNLHCQVCPRRHVVDDYSQEPADEVWLAVFEESQRLGVNRWEIVGGGEPSMRPNLLKKLVTRIKQAGMEGFLITNGTNLSADLCRLLVDNGWDNITVSLDGPEARINDRLRGLRGAFDRTVAGVRELATIRRQSSDGLPRLRMNTVFGNLNFSHLAALFELGVSLGFNEFSFQPVEIHHDEGAAIALKPEFQPIVQEQMQLVSRRARELGLTTNAAQYIGESFIAERPENKVEAISQHHEQAEEPLRFPCFEPWYLMVILASGETMPCRTYRGPKQRIGRQSLDSIWNGQVFERVRHELAIGKLMDYCQWCPVGQIVEDLRVRQALENYQKIKTTSR